MNRKTLSWLGPLALLVVVVAGVWYFVFRESPLQRVDRIMTQAHTAMGLYEFKKAEQLVLEAIEILPRSPVLRHDLAVVYLKQERLDDARSAFARAALLHGPEANEPRAIEYFQVADIDVKQGRHADAERALEMAIAAHPTNRILHTRLIDLQLGFLENPARADSSTRRFLRLCGPTPENLFDAARVHFRRKSVLGAAQLARQAALRADTLVAAHALVGRAFWRAGLPDSGLAYLEGPLQRYPDDVELWVVRGSLLIGAARYDEALQSLSRALDLEPGVFAFEDPRRIARSLKRSAETSHRRKAEPFRSAMSMLNFYINRAGSQLPKAQRARLELAKDELRALFGRPRKDARPRRRPRPGKTLRD